MFAQVAGSVAAGGCGSGQVEAGVGGTVVYVNVFVVQVVRGAGAGGRLEEMLGSRFEHGRRQTLGQTLGHVPRTVVWEVWGHHVGLEVLEERVGRRKTVSWVRLVSQQMWMMAE